MGPKALVDKSFLQALSQDEAVLLDNFFTSVICPIFYFETLSDFGKEDTSGRTPEQGVGIIASKFPEGHGTPCANHLTLCTHNLLGTPVPLYGPIPRSDGRTSQGGVIFEGSIEEQAFRRWQNGDFAEIERVLGADLRRQIDSLDLAAVARTLRSFGITPESCDSLEQAVQIARSFVTSSDRPTSRLALAVDFFGIPQSHHHVVMEKWKIRGQRPLIEYAPYAAYVLMLEIFFSVALAAGHISSTDPHNRTDMLYLMYLPFADIFVSGDKLHRRLAPLLMSHDQQFIWGADLKQDLKRLKEHYAQLPEHILETGLINFAAVPPRDGEYLVTSLWRTFGGEGPLKDKNIASAMSEETQQKLIAMIRDFEQGKRAGTGSDSKPEVLLTRSLQKRRGSFYQLPKDLKK